MFEETYPGWVFARRPGASSLGTSGGAVPPPQACSKQQGLLELPALPHRAAAFLQLPRAGGGCGAGLPAPEFSLTEHTWTFPGKTRPVTACVETPQLSFDPVPTEAIGSFGRKLLPDLF